MARHKERKKPGTAAEQEGTVEKEEIARLEGRRDASSKMLSTALLSGQSTYLGTGLTSLLLLGLMPCAVPS